MTDAVRLLSDALAVVVASDGACIRSIRTRADDRELLVQAPWADEPAGNYPPMRASSAEWHRRYPGGWHVLLPGAGDFASEDGVEQPFHGEAAWRRWHLTAEDDTCTASVLLRTIPLRLRRRIRVVGPAVEVVQDVENVGSQPVRFGWVEHPALDGRLLEGATVVIGGERHPIVSAPGGRFDDLPGRAGHWEVLADGVRIAMSWDGERFPRVYLWQERRAGTGFPWWGMVDAVGIEPASETYGRSGPHSAAFQLEPGQGMAARFTLTATPA